MISLKVPKCLKALKGILQNVAFNVKFERCLLQSETVVMKDTDTVAVHMPLENVFHATHFAKNLFVNCCHPHH